MGSTKRDLYPVYTKVRDQVIEWGISPNDPTVSIMLESIIGYEHGNASTQDVYPELSLEAYSEVVMDLIASLQPYLTHLSK